MPTYQYSHLDEKTTCKRGALFEEMEKITADPQTVCQACQQPIKRLISAGAGLIFKGSGFYQTDYKSNKPTENKKSTKEK